MRPKRRFGTIGSPVYLSPESRRMLNLIDLKKISFERLILVINHSRELNSAYRDLTDDILQEYFDTDIRLFSRYIQYPQSPQSVVMINIVDSILIILREKLYRRFLRLVMMILSIIQNDILYIHHNSNLQTLPSSFRSKYEIPEGDFEIRISIEIQRINRDYNLSKNALINDLRSLNPPIEYHDDFGGF